MALKISFFFSFVSILATLTIAVDYTVTNSVPDTPGGIRFTNEIGIDYTLQTLSTVTNFIWTTLQENTDDDKKSVSQVPVFIDNTDDAAEAYSTNNEIHINANYISSYSDNVKLEVTGLLYHEMTHVWQWNGNGEAPSGLIEGIADYMRLKSGYISNIWVYPGDGDRWDQGYDVTAEFLDYCNGLRDGFVAELNKKMRYEYSDGFFVDLLGKTVDQLWAEYKQENAH